MTDLEHGLASSQAVRSFGWTKARATVVDRTSRDDKVILNDVEGMVGSGEMLALLGPSGSGKTTLLNVLAQRKPSSNAKFEGKIYINGSGIRAGDFRRIAAYVEQEDNLLGTLTVAETLDFAAQLGLPTSVSKQERGRRVHALLKAFGLVNQSDTHIGTPVQKGISGGQKRRVSVAAQLITNPKLLFLDEPTSGLDSAAAIEVVETLREVATSRGLIVIASLHQPSGYVLSQFHKLLFLATGGHVAYYGPVDEVIHHIRDAGLGLDRDFYRNPVEYLMSVVNDDFGGNSREKRQALEKWQSSGRIKRNRRDLINERLRNELGGAATARATSRQAGPKIEADLGVVIVDKISDSTASESGNAGESQLSPSSAAAGEEAANGGGMWLAAASAEAPQLERWRKTLKAPVTLVRRSFLKSIRDVTAYHIRIAMYVGLAVMMGTVWLRLQATQSNIQSFINAIFFGGAFMSFMAVAYIPAFLEDYATFLRERANGLYGPTAFLVANFLTGLPYLFLITLLFSLVAYWLSNFRPSAGGFFTWVMWLFLDLLAAESLVVLISSLVPIFVVALASTAFANGLWMCTGGFLVPPQVLNPFWRYVFHPIDYQSYVFQGMMVNEFASRNYTCDTLADGSCDCMYRSELADQCLIDGNAVLDSYGFSAANTGRSVGVMIAIIAAYRALGWLVLYLKTR